MQTSPNYDRYQDALNQLKKANAEASEACFAMLAESARELLAAHGHHNAETLGFDVDFDVHDWDDGKPGGVSMYYMPASLVVDYDAPTSSDLHDQLYDEITTYLTQEILGDLYEAGYRNPYGPIGDFAYFTLDLNTGLEIPED